MADEYRGPLGVRMAEAMGWEREECTDGCCVAYRDRPFGDPDATMLTPEALAGWAGYPHVDAWMREQGWKKQVIWLSQTSVLADYWAGWTSPGRGQHLDDNADEPLAVVQAALKAIEEGKDAG